MRLILLSIGTLLLVAVAGGCSTNTGVVDNTEKNSPGYMISYIYDEQHDVGIWLFGTAGSYGKAIAVLPGKDFQRPEAPAVLK